MFLYLSGVDHAVGFGGKYGIQKDRVDKSAKGWSEHTQPGLHPSQADYKKGFGGKFGVDSENQDKVKVTLFVVCVYAFVHACVCYMISF